MWTEQRRPYYDPEREAWRRIFRTFRNWGLLLLLVGLGVFIRGVPHVQWNYEYVGNYTSNDSVPATAKVSASYLGPFGVQHVKAGKYGRRGCPVMHFIPLWDCFD